MMKPYYRNVTTGAVGRAVCRQLTSDDLGALMQLQEEAVSALTDSSLLIPRERAWYEGVLAGGGGILGIFTSGALCAFCAITMPGNAPDSLARDLGMDGEQLGECAVIDCLTVSPDWEKNGAARDLVSFALRRAAGTPGVRYVLAAVSPKDSAGVVCFLSVNGFRIRALRQKDGCRLRYILCFRERDDRLFATYERIALDDVYTISKFLSDGYEGVATFCGDGNAWIWLAK